MTTERQARQRSVAENRSTSTGGHEADQTSALEDLRSWSQTVGTPAYTVREIDRDPPDLPEVVGGFRARTVCLMSGRPGVSKTQTTVSVAAICATGVDFLRIFVDELGVARTVRQGAVVFLALEDPKEITDRRIAKFRRDVRRHITAGKPMVRDGLVLDEAFLDRLQDNLIVIPIAGTGRGLYDRGDNGTPRRTDYFENLAKKLIRLKPTLIIVDTFRRAKGPFSELDEHLISMVLADFEAIATQADSLLLLVHHTVKAAEESDDDMMIASGSGAIAGTCRGMIVLKRVFDDQGEPIPDLALMKTAKNNYDRPSRPAAVEQQQGYVVPLQESVEWFETAKKGEAVGRARARASEEGNTPATAASRRTAPARTGMNRWKSGAV